jgi:hypothetical protein
LSAAFDFDLDFDLAFDLDVDLVFDLDLALDFDFDLAFDRFQHQSKSTSKAADRSVRPTPNVQSLLVQLLLLLRNT